MIKAQKCRLGFLPQLIFLQPLSHKGRGNLVMSVVCNPIKLFIIYPLCLPPYIYPLPSSCMIYYYKVVTDLNLVYNIGRKDLQRREVLCLKDYFRPKQWLVFVLPCLQQ